MKLAASFFVIIVAITFIGSAMAIQPGKTLTFKGGENGKVVFSGKIHAEKGVKCMECHDGKVFPTMKEALKVPGPPTLQMKEINAGKFCGTCHNGERAFKSSDEKNCTKCHIKEEIKK